VLAQQTWPRFEKAMAPKVAGAWHLHRLTDALDFFVLFSSMASVFGTPGQGNYAAANGFLDGLAHFRRARGQAGLSINWGPWDGGEWRRPDAQDIRRWDAQGIGLIPSSRVSPRSNRRSPIGAQIGVCRPTGRRRWRSIRRMRSLRCCAISRRERPPRAHSPPKEASSLLARCGSSRRTAVRRSSDHVREQAIRVLGLDPSFPLDTRVGWRTRTRFADGARAQEPAAAQHRSAASVDAGVRLPDRRSRSPVISSRSLFRR
jgi:hypothetical protein